MFEWYWVFLFYLLLFHITSVSYSLYLHRAVAHGHFKISKPLEYVFRFILWTGEFLGPRYAEAYSSRHRRHHKNSDTDQDPHSPFYMSLKEMCGPKSIIEEDVIKYCPDVKTPNDWMQRTLHEKYRTLGPWVVHFIALVLFGIPGAIVSILIRASTKQWLLNFTGNYATHKIGFSYAGNRFEFDKSKIIFPIGIIMAGEELHANHHNYPRSPNFRQKWFELDIGYVYAIVLSKFNLLEISESYEQRTI